MASLDDVVSNLKNIVLNLSGLSTGTTLANSITTLTLSINGIASTLSTAFATAHSFGGGFVVPANTTVNTVSNLAIASNAVVVTQAASQSASFLLIDSGAWATNVVAGSFQFILFSPADYSSGGAFTYVGYNP